MKDLVLSHFTTWHFVDAIAPYLKYAVLKDAYKVSKEQTVFHFEGAEGPFHLLCYFSGHNAFFWTQKEYGKPRSKYNTVFKSFFGTEVRSISAFHQERSFGIQFEDKNLLFALFGRLNHLLTVEKEQCLDGVWKVQMPGGNEVSFTESAELQADPVFVKKVLGKSVSEEAVPKAVAAIASGSFALARNDKEKVVFNYGEQNAFWTGDNVLEALFKYSRTWFKEFHFSHTYQKIEKHLEREKKRLEKGYKAAEQQLDRLENELNYRMWADLLMANMHQLKGGEKSVSLPDFYGEGEIQIPLKSKLNIQENAAAYYRKAKNQSKEQEVLEQRMERFLEQMEAVEEHAENLAELTEIKPLLALEKELFEKETPQKKKQATDFQEYEIGGFKVYVGRNSKNNDALTLGFASKNDLWLHAKDLAGSHVVIRNKGSETKFPKFVIEQAAEIAAHFSKGRNQEFCPVLYTPKKYVRKPKGARAGAVLVDREEVVLVRPGLPKN